MYMPSCSGPSEPRGGAVGQGWWVGEALDHSPDIDRLVKLSKLGRTITYKLSLTQKKLYNKTDAIFSIYRKNGINP